MIYTLSGLLCLVTVGFPDIRRFSPRYLIAGSVLFVSYEICLALSLGYAATRSQAIEVGMVNYLWPSLTIVFAILFNGQKSTLWVIPGLLISLLGVCWVLGGEEGLHLEEITRNVVSSPLSYALAFAGAFIWAAYCTVTSKFCERAKRHHPVCFADRAESVGEICPERSARHGVHASGSREAGYVRYRAWVWLRRLEYWHPAR